MSEPQSALAKTRTMRAVYLALGLVMTALGIIGAFLPLMPTTIFLILAAWCFSKSSRRLETWLLGHPILGPTITNWRTHGVIAPRAKALACSGMALGYVLFWISAHPGPWLALLVAVVLGACATYVLSRPSAPSA
ncbi:YbaN family protein [Devosia sp. Leaf64]|jgi:uncharacterized membrane protein YbaN (DUF454 family)|uniref:YbaN family protein n=1 Tax=Devosia sp. Leaf64 TaxID=1736229 RepID=UPI000715F602|nr:YbaN family protein [Devosia sp. Leaf64]KQN74006.1 hypothetical protein ASE94_03065 [Devosia sp. Leaf64]